MGRITQADEDLEKAASIGDLSGVQDALARGGDPNVTTSFFGGTPFFAAIKARSLDCVKLMIDAGAEINLQVTRGAEYPLMLADIVRSRDVQALLQSLGAQNPCAIRAKQFTAAAAVEIALDADARIQASGYQGIIDSGKVDYIYDFRDSLVTVGSKRKLVAVRKFIETMEEIGCRPSVKRVLAFMSEFEGHFAKMSSDYLKVQENLAKLCKACENEETVQTSATTTGEFAVKRPAKKKSASDETSPKASSSRLSKKATCELVKDGDTQMVWNGFDSLVTNNDVTYVYQLRDSLKVIGAEKKVALLTKCIDKLEAGGGCPKDEEAVEILERERGFFLSLDSEYLALEENVENLTKAYAVRKTLKKNI